MSTRGDIRNPAEIARERGWVPGTRLAGRAPSETTVIEITAIGERCVLAKMIRVNDYPANYDTERTWVFHHRDWEPVPQ